MPKRFTDINIWVDKPWFIELTPVEKCAFMFVKDRCDNVGVWVPNFKMAEVIIGDSVDWDALVEKLHENIVVLENGKWWLRDMCVFQYGNLSEDCIPHRSYIALLKKHGLFERVSKGYVKGSYTPKEKEKEKEKDLEKEKEKETRTREEKKEYAQYVHMTKKEHEKLILEYGKDATGRMIRKLDNYKGSNGKKYNSDYRAILSWVVEEMGFKPLISAGPTKSEERENAEMLNKALTGTV